MEKKQVLFAAGEYQKFFMALGVTVSDEERLRVLNKELDELVLPISEVDIRHRLKSWRAVYALAEVIPADYPHDQLLAVWDREEKIQAHCLGMIPQMEQFIVGGRWHKVLRWYGFVYGATATFIPRQQGLMDSLQLPMLALRRIINAAEIGDMLVACKLLGLVQGVLWGRGLYSLEALKNHNRPQGTG